MERSLIIANDPPYGTERTYNALRVAHALAKKDVAVRVFLIGDAASCAKSDQQVPNGYYNLEVMLRGVLRRGGEVGVCGTCMDARGMSDEELVEGTHRSSMAELADWIIEADETLEF